MTRRSENYAIAVLAVALMAIFGFRIFKDSRINRNIDDFALLLNQLSMMKAVEGKNISNLIDDENEKLRIAEIMNKQPYSAKFVIVLSDSSCSPCFANFISNYINDLRENGIEIDASQWYGLFVGKKQDLGEITFNSTFGNKSTLIQIHSFDSTISLKEAYILFLDEKNFILASSKVYGFSNDLRLFFSSRVANYFHSDKK